MTTATAAPPTADDTRIATTGAMLYVEPLLDAGLSCESAKRKAIDEGHNSSIAESAIDRLTDPETGEHNATLTAGGFPRVDNGADWITSAPGEPDQILSGVFDQGDKLAIIGGSKTRKTFLALQLALKLAAGDSFLGWDVVSPLVVLVVQLEIKREHYWRRFKRMMYATGGKIDDRLHILNCRGHEIDMAYIGDVARQIGAQVIVFDPFYKLMDGDENSAQDVKPILRKFDTLCEDTGAAVVYTHHDPKGNAAERDIRDRGAGSNVLSRDYDACLTLTAHRDEPDAAVVGVLLRNYPPQDPFSIRWTDGHYQVDAGLIAITGKGGKYDAAIRQAIADDPEGSLKDIADVVGCDRSTVSRVKKRLGVA